MSGYGVEYGILTIIKLIHDKLDNCTQELFMRNNTNLFSRPAMDDSSSIMLG